MRVLACLVTTAGPTRGIEEPTQLAARARRSSQFAGCSGCVRAALGGVVVAQTIDAYGDPCPQKHRL